MNEQTRSKHYSEILKKLPKPTDPNQLKTFCADYETAVSLIHNLRTLDEEPTVEFYELLLRLEFLIAKNSRPDLAAGYFQATQNIQQIKSVFISQNPDLGTQLKFKRKLDQTFEDQIAYSIYVSIENPKSWNRFKYIRETAQKKDNPHLQHQNAQQRFRQVYQGYSTKTSKTKS